MKMFLKCKSKAFNRMEMKYINLQRFHDVMAENKTDKNIKESINILE